MSSGSYSATRNSSLRLPPLRNATLHRLRGGLRAVHRPIDQGKGRVEAVSAFAAMAEIHNCRLVAVGDGQLRAIADHLEHKQNVLFVSPSEGAG